MLLLLLLGAVFKGAKCEDLKTRNWLTCVKYGGESKVTFTLSLRNEKTRVSFDDHLQVLLDHLKIIICIILRTQTALVSSPQPLVGYFNRLLRLAPWIASSIIIVSQPYRKVGQQLKSKSLGSMTAHQQWAAPHLSNRLRQSILGLISRSLRCVRIEIESSSRD